MKVNINIMQIKMVYKLKYHMNKNLTEIEILFLKKV